MRRSCRGAVGRCGLGAFAPAARHALLVDTSTVTSSASAEGAEAGRRQLLARTLGYDPAKVETFVQRIHGTARDGPMAARRGQLGNVERSLRCAPVRGRRAVRGAPTVSVSEVTLVRQLCDLQTASSDAVWVPLLSALRAAHASRLSDMAVSDEAAAFANLLHHGWASTRWSTTAAQDESLQTCSAMRVLALLVCSVEKSLAALCRATRRRRSQPPTKADAPNADVGAYCTALDEVTRLLTHHSAPLGTSDDAAAHMRWCSTVATRVFSCATLLTLVGGDTAQVAKTREQLLAVLPTLCDALLSSSIPSSSSCTEDGGDELGDVGRRAARVVHATRQRERTTTHAPSATEQTATVSLCVAHLVWLTRAITSAVSGTGTAATSWTATQWAALQGGVRVMEELWQTVAALSPARTRVDASTLYHRTTHSALNFHVAHLWQSHRRDASGRQQLEITSGAASDALHGFFVTAPTTAATLLRTLDELVKVVLGLAQKGPPHALLPRWIAATSVRTVGDVCAVLCRTGLDVELCLSAVAARETGLEWSVPIHLTSQPHHTESPVTTAGVESKVTQWNELGVCAAQLRTRLALLVEEVFTTLARGELGATPGASASSRFVAGIASSYLPLMRRHWCSTHGCREERLGAAADGDVALRDPATLMASCLRVFVLLKEFAATVKQWSTSSEDKARCCGTTLSQAMEVAFFLTFFAARWGSHDESEVASDALRRRLGIGAHDVESYVKEMLLMLDHNTAKQLRHLRHKDTLFYFAGVTRDGTWLQDERLQSRHARSTLEVVHAHVMHPSLLWMPLWQLQEMVFLVTHHAHLFFDDDDGDAARRRQVVQVKDRTTDFGRLQHYLVLRLYVVTNVLRGLRALLQRHAVATLDECGDAAWVRSHAGVLAALASREPDAESARRLERRPWARAMATLLLTHHPDMPAAVEGVGGTKRGMHRVLQRVESTVQMARRHHLYADRLDGEAESRAQWMRVTAGVEKGDVASGDAACGQCRLRLRRPHATAPLGFVLDGGTATLRRVHGTDDADASPFAAAAQDAGFASAQSLVGWRVTAVDAAPVTDGRSAIDLVRDKLSFELTLVRDEVGAGERPGVT